MSRTSSGCPPSVVSPRWLSIEHAVQYSGVSKTTIYRALRSGELLGSQRSKSGTWRIRVDDIDTWLRGGQAGAA